MTTLRIVELATELDFVGGGVMDLGELSFVIVVVVVVDVFIVAVGVVVVGVVVVVVVVAIVAVVVVIIVIVVGVGVVCSVKVVEESTSHVTVIPGSSFQLET